MDELKQTANKGAGDCAIAPAPISQKARKEKLKEAVRRNVRASGGALDA